MSIFDLNPGPLPWAAYHVVGTTETGPTDAPVMVHSMSQYADTFGGRSEVSAALYDDLSLYFSEGGITAWVSRVPALTLTDIATALTAAGPSTRGTAVAAPGLPAAVVGTTLVDHAVSYSKLALVSPEAHASAGDAVGVATALSTHPGADHAGVLWPWLIAPDATGTTRPRNPTGFAAAARSKAHHAGGFWVHPAGDRSTARAGVSLVTPAYREDAWELADSRVSVIATTPSGVQLYGWWSLSNDRANFPHLTTRDLLNNTAVELAARYARIATTSWDTPGRVVSQIRVATVAVLRVLTTHHALTPGAEGMDADPGYRLTVTHRPAENVVEVKVLLRPRQYGRIVGLEVIRVPLHLPLSTVREPLEVRPLP